MTRATSAQRVAVGKRYYQDSAIRAQEDAALLADREGNKAEAVARRNSAKALRDKHKREEGAQVYILSPWLVRALGSARDPIANLIRKHMLTVAHGRAALALREFREYQTITITNGGEMGVYVDSEGTKEMIDMVIKRDAGHRLWLATLEAADPETRRAVKYAILGKALTKCRHALPPMRNDRKYGVLAENIGRSLDVAVAHLGELA